MTEKEVGDIKFNTEILFHFKYIHVSVYFYKARSPEVYTKSLVTVSGYPLKLNKYKYIWETHSSNHSY